MVAPSSSTDPTRTTTALQAPIDQQPCHREFVFIDDRVTDSQALIDAILAGEHEVNSIHIISHGSSGTHQRPTYFAHRPDKRDGHHAIG